MARTNRTIVVAESLPGVNLQTLANDAIQILPPATFASMKGWEKLNPQEQTVVQSEGQMLAQALIVNGASRLSIGEHLTKLQGVLEPHNLFVKFLRNFHFSRRSAYRRINEFKNASKSLPEMVVKVAAARGMAIAGDSETAPLGIYTEAVRKLPPPTTPDIEQAGVWLDQVEKVRKDSRSSAATAGVGVNFNMPEPLDPNTALKECVAFVKNRYSKLPNTARVKSKWLSTLQGMLLGLSGIGSAQTIEPQAIPEGFLPQRGRPRPGVQSAAVA